MESLRLLPHPQHVEELGGVLELPAGAEPNVRAALDPTASAHPEGYLLVVGSVGDVVVLRAPTEAGLRHGRHTLAQLRRRFPEAIPRVRIEDWPDFATRGVMLDVSRDRVPTMAHLEHVVELLASLKINHLQLYTEHTFAYAGHEEVWRDASPLTPDEIRRLDSHCRAHGIELVANQNCFGHLHRWMKHERYAPLAETHGKWQFLQWEKEGPFSLCPGDPGSIALIDDLLGQLLPCFESPLVNIGCDETYDVGQGRSRGEVERRGRADVYFEFLGRVCDAARGHGGRPMFWADIALSHPEAVSRIPEDVIALAWGYEPDSPFDRWMEVLGGAGREAWVCPGTSSWRTYLGRSWEKRDKLERAAKEGKGRATGYLITDWGDLGHRQQWPISLQGLAMGAGRAWNAEADPHLQAIGLHAFGDPGGGAAWWIEGGGECDVALREVAGLPDADGRPTRLRNAQAIFQDEEQPLEGGRPVGDVRLWERCDARLLGHDPNLGGLTDALVRRELEHALRAARLATRRGLLRARALAGTAPSPADRQRLAEDYETLIAEHRDLWLERSRPGGLDDSCAHYQRLIDELRA